MAPRRPQTRARQKQTTYTSNQQLALSQPHETPHQVLPLQPQQTSNTWSDSPSHTQNHQPNHKPLGTILIAPEQPRSSRRSQKSRTRRGAGATTSTKPTPAPSSARSTIRKASHAWTQYRRATRMLRPLFGGGGLGLTLPSQSQCSAKRVVFLRKLCALWSMNAHVVSKQMDMGFAALDVAAWAAGWAI